MVSNTMPSHRSRGVSKDNSAERLISNKKGPVAIGARTRSTSTNANNLKSSQSTAGASTGGGEPIKSGSVHLKPLQTSTKMRRKGLGGAGLTNASVTNRNESGILEERGESTCSSKNPINVLSDGLQTQSSMYPRLKEGETRKSCQIIETIGATGERLEGTEELKMPPVSSAVA